MALEITLPVLGDGIKSGDVLEVLVREGEQIRKEQGIIEIETDKATVEVPCSHAGRVLKVHVREGDTVQVGQALISLEEEAGATFRPPAKSPPAAPPESFPGPESTLATAATARPSSPPIAVEAPSPQPAARVVPAASPAAATALSAPSLGDTTRHVMPAGPMVRRFAREVGIDLSQVQGTGTNGRITREDVLEFVRRANQSLRQTPTEGPTAEDSRRDAWGPVRGEKMARIRKTIAAKMQESWSTVPRVTNFDDADITDLDRIRRSSKDDYAAKGIKLSSLPFVIKSVATALRDHAAVNATLDLPREQIVYKHYIHIGIAVDTDRGLVVPSLRNADRLTIPEIARQVAALAENVRNGNFTVDDLRGSTFTISNLGAVGGSYSTPMVNVPEVAILLVGRSRKMPVVINDQVAIRLIMPLSLSYDHRLVDGATAARFLNDVIAYLEAPSRLLLAP